MAMAGLYTKLAIGGVNCLLWLHNTTTKTTTGSEKRKLKKQKNELGTKNLETPILDQRINNNHTEYCDAIIHSDHLDKWEIAIRNCFAQSKLNTSNSTNGNKKIVIRNRENTEDQLIIHLYTSAYKLMVQPGNFSEKNLLDFIKLIPSLQPLPSNSGVWEPEKQPLPTSQENYKFPLQVKLPPLDKAHNPGSFEGCSHNTMIDESEYGKQDNNSTILSPWKDRIHSNGAILDDVIGAQSNTSQYTTLKDTSSQTDALSTISAGTQMNVVIKDNETQTEGIQPELVQGTRMIVDELLFFVQNKLSVSPQPLDILVRTCTNFYNAGEILASKQVLFASIKQDRFRLIKRIGKDKKQDDLMDICKLLLSTEIERMPMFVAKELSKVPCTTDTYDVTKVHKDLEEVRKSICALSQNQTELVDLVNTKLGVHNLTRHITDSQTQTQGTDLLEIRQGRHVQMSPTVISPNKHAKVSVRHHSPSQDASGTVSSARGPCDSVTHGPREATPNASVASSSNASSKASVASSSIQLAEQSQGDKNSSTSCLTEPPPLMQGSKIPPRMASEISEEVHAHDMSLSSLPVHSYSLALGSFRTIDEASITEPSTYESRSFTKMSRKSDVAVRLNHSWKKHIRSSTPSTSAHNNNQWQHNNVLYGKGKPVGLQAVRRKPRNIQQSKGNTNITGTFISRLDRRTTAADLKLFIRREFGLSVRPEKLTNKTGLCSSFYIPGNHHLRKKLMNVDMWPEGTLIKPFVQY